MLDAGTEAISNAVVDRSESRRRIMTKPIDMSQELRMSRDRSWTARDVEMPNLSLASRLEANHSVAGRVAQWLFIKGGMAILLILGLMLLGLIGGLVGAR
jgi:hypothetical protein